MTDQQQTEKPSRRDPMRYAAYARDWSLTKWVKVGRICPTFPGARRAAPLNKQHTQDQVAIWSVNGDGKPVQRLSVRNESTGFWLDPHDYDALFDATQPGGKAASHV